DLNLKGMQLLWGKKVSDLSFGEFVGVLRYVCQKRGVVLHQVERYYPSSKTCNRCGVVNDKLALSDRHWRCVCGVAHDRDANASINIRDRAWSLFRGTVRPGVAPARAA
ncbi:MAG: zinc ribbon domain-containing protein, partial [Rhodothermales bacterium]